MGKRICMGDPVWYADPEEGVIESGSVYLAKYEGQNLVSISIDFDDGDFDEFYSEAIGRSIFLSEDAAKASLAHGIGG